MDRTPIQRSRHDVRLLYEYTNAQFYKIPAEGAPATRIGADFDEDPFLATWTPKGIFLVGWERTERRLYKVDPTTGCTSVHVDVPERIRSVDFTPDGGTVALVARTSTTLDVYRSSSDRSGLHR